LNCFEGPRLQHTLAYRIIIIRPGDNGREYEYTQTRGIKLAGILKELMSDEEYIENRNNA
jgi:hypothetical protein